MSPSFPPIRIAGPQEASVVCPRCDVEIALGDPTVVCPRCRHVHHAACWGEGCGSYECAPAARSAATGPVLRVTAAEIADAVPLMPTRTAPSFGEDAESIRNSTRIKRRLNVWALVALLTALISLGTGGVGLITSLVGLQVAGLLTGLAALILGIIGVLAHSHRRRGLGLAVLGLCLGLGNLVCWTVALSDFGRDAARAHFDLEEFEPDPESLADLPEAIGRAMRANVLITAEAGWESMFAAGIGSGVILRIEDGMALVVTNRHVIDMEFDEGGSETPVDLAGLAHVTVKMIGQPALGAQVVWVAPDGIDLALLNVPVTADEPRAAHWDTDRHVVVGEDVFAIGNPHGLGWTHTGGDVSQIRTQEHISRTYKVIQTSAPINSGNSGGGLYSHDGRLIGINTWTQDKRFSEGLGFSIAIPTLFELAPAQFKLAARQGEDQSQ